MAGRRGTSKISKFGHLTSSKGSSFEAEYVENPTRTLGETGANIVRERVCRGQNEAHRSAGLGVNRIGEPKAAHLTEYAHDPFAEFSRDTKVGADPDNAGVTGISADSQWFGRVGESGKTAGIRDLDSIRKYLESNVIACHRVRAIHLEG